MKKIVSTLAAVLMIMMALFQPKALSASSAVLYDPLTKTVVAGVQDNVQRGMASTTKIMTALVALELYELDQVVEIQPEWCGAEGSSMYLRAGEKLTVSDLLYGLMLSSGNDAAVALSCIYSGNSDDFVGLMNTKALELGLTNTHFDNPNGLDSETHYSTARDMAVLTAAAMENEAFREIVSTKSIQIGERYLSNHNKLLSMLDGAEGVKTGFTKKCGRCLVSSASRMGRRLIAVTLNAPDDWNDHITLMNQGFERFETRTVLSAGEIGSITVAAGERCRTVGLYIEEDFTYALAEDEQPVVTLRGPRIVYGPVDGGQQYGTVRIALGDTVLAELPVYFTEGVAVTLREKSSWEQMTDWFKDLWELLGF